MCKYCEMTRKLGDDWHEGELYEVYLGCNASIERDHGEWHLCIEDSNDFTDTHQACYTPIRFCPWCGDELISSNQL